MDPNAGMTGGKAVTPDETAEDAAEEAGQPEDTNMAVDAEVGEDEDGSEDLYDEEGLAIIKDKITILPGASADLSSCSFCIVDEDHTLGNALRYVIMKDPSVEFCGYSIPHPSENKVNMRIQMLEPGTSALDALHRGLTRCDELCQVILDTYETAVQRDLPHIEMDDEDEQDPLDGALTLLESAKEAKGEEVKSAELKTWIDIASGRTLIDSEGPTSSKEKRKRKSKGQ